MKSENNFQNNFKELSNHSMMVCFDLERLGKYHIHFKHQVHNMSTEGMDELFSLKHCIKDRMYQLNAEMLQNTLKYNEQMANGMCLDIFDAVNGLEVRLLQMKHAF